VLRGTRSSRHVLYQILAQLGGTACISASFNICTGGRGITDAPFSVLTSTYPQTIAKKEEQLATEKRLVMRGWLKQLFLGQSLVAIALSGLVVCVCAPLSPSPSLSVVLSISHTRSFTLSLSLSCLLGFALLGFLCSASHWGGRDVGC
jgi:hypothetical protein